MQVLIGPRQVGKTTLARQAMQLFGESAHYISADEPSLKQADWLHAEWQKARLKAVSGQPALLVIDEVQKAQNWSEAVKLLWDEDSRNKTPLYVILLGSSPLLVQKGLTESLAGRFEIIPVTHWSYAEMREAFDWSLDQYLYFGGYPGGAALVSDEDRWRQYIRDSLIETTVSRDLLLLTRVDKPALLRRLFLLACEYSAQVLSYQKMLGQLQDSSNTVTLAHYLDLLAGAGLVCGLQKYAGQRVRQKGSSPKLAVFNTALMSALTAHSFSQVMNDPEYRGRLVESAVIAYALNSVRGTDMNLYYWLDRNREVDLILARGDAVTAFEIKSSRKRVAAPGLTAFEKAFPSAKIVLIGSAEGISLETFLTTSLEQWLEA